MSLEIGLQLVALFGKVVKPLGDGLLLEKVCYMGQGALRFYSSATLLSLYFGTTYAVCWADLVPPHCDEPCPRGTVSQHDPFPVSCLCRSVLSQ